MNLPAGDYTLVLFDGVCGLCNRFVDYVLKRDVDDRYRFAPLQSALAGEILRRHGFSAEDLDTIWVIRHPGCPNEQPLRKARGAMAVLSDLPGPGKFLTLFNWLPIRILDFIYDLVAANRYRIFGKNSSCRIPSHKERNKFLDFVH